MSARKRLMVLTPRLPYPVVGGDRLRIYHIAKELSRHLDLTLVSLVESRAELSEPVDEVFGAVHRVLLPPWRSRLATAVAVPTRMPLQVAYYRSQAFLRAAQAAYPGHHGTFAHLLRTDAVARQLPGPRFLEMTDAISLNYERVRARASMRSSRDPRILVYGVEFRRLKALERAVPAAYDCSFLVSDVDREYLYGDRPPPGPVVVAPNGVDLERLPYHPVQERTDPVIVFIGNICSLQNSDAVESFVTEVLPLIRAVRPDVRMRVIGRIPPDKARAFRAITGVEVTGEVSDVAREARGAAVAVAPMRLGAGVQNKVLEYLALGIPTVTSEVGREGLSVSHQEELLVASEAHEVSAAVLSLLEDPALAHRLSRAGRDYVEREHDWSATLAPLVERVVDAVHRLR